MSLKPPTAGTPASATYGLELANALADVTVVKEGPLNVKDVRFGAVGDGSTDDTAAIALALAHSAWPTSKAHLFFPPGDYKVTSTTTLNGGGASSTPQILIEGPGARITTTSAIRIFTITNSIVSLTRVRMRGLTLLTNIAGATGVYLNNAQACRFSDVVFTGSFSTGMEIAGTSTYNKLIGCEFASLARGINVTGLAHYLGVNGCDFSEQLSGSPLNWIEVNGTGNTNGLKLVGNTFYGSGATLPVVRLTTAIAAVVRGNTFDQAGDTALQLNGLNCLQAAVAGNSFQNVQKHGIHLFNTARHSVCNNSFNSTSQASAGTYDDIAIEASAEIGKSTVMGNVSNSDATQTNFHVNEIAGANHNVVVGNLSRAGVNVLGASSVNANNHTV